MNQPCRVFLSIIYLAYVSITSFFLLDRLAGGSLTIGLMVFTMSISGSLAWFIFWLNGYHIKQKFTTIVLYVISICIFALFMWMLLLFDGIGATWTPIVNGTSNGEFNIIPQDTIITFPINCKNQRLELINMPENFTYNNGVFSGIMPENTTRVYCDAFCGDRQIGCATLNILVYDPDYTYNWQIVSWEYPTNNLIWSMSVIFSLIALDILSIVLLYMLVIFRKCSNEENDELLEDKYNVRRVLLYIFSALLVYSTCIPILVLPSRLLQYEAGIYVGVIIFVNLIIWTCMHCCGNNKKILLYHFFFHTVIFSFIAIDNRLITPMIILSFCVDVIVIHLLEYQK